MSSKCSSKLIDHLGLVSGLCKDVGLIKHLDKRSPKEAKNSKISFGQLFLAMILNGLGFVGRTLHMFPQYFEGKLLVRLSGESIKPEYIFDDSLGRFG